MAKDVLPNAIPVDGARYNLTLMRMGKGKGSVNCVFVIDSGDKRGHRISGTLTTDLHDIIFEALDKAGVGEADAGFYSIDDAKFFGEVNKHAKKIRVSGIVRVTRQAYVEDDWILVEEDYQDSNVKVTYEIEKYSEPTDNSEIAEKL